MAGGKVVKNEDGAEIIKTEDAIPMYHEVFGGKDRMRFVHLVQERQRLYLLMKDAEKQLGSTEKPGLSQEIELMMAEHNCDTVNIDKWTVVATGGKNVGIKRELLIQALLESGMEPKMIEAVVEAATVTKPYTYIQIQQTKTLLTRTEELGISAKAKGKIHAVGAAAARKGKGHKK